MLITVLGLRKLFLISYVTNPVSAVKLKTPVAATKPTTLSLFIQLYM